MNSQLNQPIQPPGGAGEVAVSLLATEPPIRSKRPEDFAAARLALEHEVQHRAEAMTDVLQRIMERPPAIRHWGLNE